MIDQSLKFIYIHIPKCAGTSIYKSLDPGIDDINLTKHGGWDSENNIYRQHATYTQIKEFYCPNIHDYYTFTFVRNPWSRILSDYFWMQRELKVVDSFKNFILQKNNFNIPELKYPHINSCGRGDHLIPQSDFILNSEGEQMVNFIGKFESIQTDYNIVCHKIGIATRELPHKNKTKHKHYTEYYDDETKQIVAEKYAKDIELFGYKFGK